MAFPLSLHKMEERRNASIHLYGNDTMNITLYGNDARLSVCQKNLSSVPREGTLYLLPIPSFRPGITPPFTGLAPGPRDAVVGYAIPDDKKRALTANGAALLDLEDDAVYQKENAELTALGVFSRILQSRDAAPGDLSVGIVGFGKIGEALLKILVFFGARLSVYTRNPVSEKDLLPLGIDVYPSVGFAYHGEDVLVNTAPAPLLSRDAFGETVPLIFDVATGDCVGAGLPFEKMPAVPLKMFGKSATRCYTDAVSRFLREAGL